MVSVAKPFEELSFNQTWLSLSGMRSLSTNLEGLRDKPNHWYKQAIERALVYGADDQGCPRIPNIISHPADRCCVFDLWWWSYHLGLQFSQAELNDYYHTQPQREKLQDVLAAGSPKITRQQTLLVCDLNVDALTFYNLMNASMNVHKHDGGIYWTNPREIPSQEAPGQWFWGIVPYPEEFRFGTIIGEPMSLAQLLQFAVAGNTFRKYCGKSTSINAHLGVTWAAKDSNTTGLYVALPKDNGSLVQIVEHSQKPGGCITPLILPLSAHPIVAT